MSLNRYAKQRDANEREIIDALQGVGAKVWQLDRPVDLLVLFRGVFHLLEVKNPKRSYTVEPGQQAFFADCEGAPVALVLTVEEALAAIGAVEPQAVTL